MYIDKRRKHVSLIGLIKIYLPLLSSFKGNGRELNALYNDFFHVGTKVRIAGL